MDLSKIISLTGKSGLFKIVGNSKSALIVSDLKDGKRIPVMATHRISSLDEISIYTDDEDMPLIEVLIKIREHEKGAVSIDPKGEGKELREYFEKIVPEYDQERVYTSDLKKLFTWYNLLHAADMVKDLALEEEKNSSEEAVGSTTEEKTE